ncbi:alpha,alpha-trehalose-phosphate synthase (UDP-forming) [Azospirillum sp. TSO22-1]|uniref:alpha,alpha-trehalose-phosphate synthase (UDP-forming) n=1 Tax=Azospirillum sp. TSO22-1 TaxID=716789 RepID=UPI000D61E545|nr:alpha,alpha-trehalose-phosphate synthase (UDP-forming) [Azospirillum sp. TSO22-1]PWC54542.1 alpha,alpha-trehalose-phosphate synthase [Azospirillum sp. TSO22-1]
MSRLVVVSNRVAPIDEGKQTAGGLAVAVLAALKKSGGIWFGWSGTVVEDESQSEPTRTDAGRLTYATLDLGRRDFEEYYNGFANQTLWPLFHYRLGLVSVDRRTREGYQRVNGIFADRLAPLLHPDDMVWVHDYHLIPLGEELRTRGCGQRLGFFLHTPFPAPEVLKVLPNHADLVRQLCAYDLLGFHTEVDLRCFANYIRYEARGEVDERGHDGGQGGGIRIRAFGRTLLACAFPISIDTANLESLAQTAARSRHAERLRESLAGRRLIIGVDRLDYSKGLPKRFEAFQQLMETYPEHCNRVSFLQIAPPSREDVPEYIAIRRELSELSGRINGHFAEFDWVPIRYLNKSFGRRILAGFYRQAHIGLVTPLRDGMNLVAKEYVACQDPGNPGVLVLSEFAGAALELAQALIVNPYDTEGVADALQRGLTMPLEERKERHAALMGTLRRNDITAWRESYVNALTRAPYS